MVEFSRFLSGANLNAQQEEYVKTIIAYVCQNGDITLENLVNTEPFSEYEWIDIFGQNFTAVRNFVNKIHGVVSVASGEVVSIGQAQSGMSISSPSNSRGRKAEEVRFIAPGSMLTEILPDTDECRLIHNMMELNEGTTIMQIVVECQKQFQEKYFNMSGNDWRHLISDYVRTITSRPELREDEVFRFSVAG